MEPALQEREIEVRDVIPNLESMAGEINGKWGWPIRMPPPVPDLTPPSTPPLVVHTVVGEWEKAEGEKEPTEEQKKEQEENKYPEESGLVAGKEDLSRTTNSDGPLFLLTLRSWLRAIDP